MGFNLRATNTILKKRHGWIIRLGGIAYLLIFSLVFIYFKFFAASPPTEEVKNLLMVSAFGCFSLIVAGLLMLVFFPSPEDREIFRGYHKLFAVGVAVCFVGVCLGAYLKDNHLLKTIFNVGVAIVACGIVKSWHEARNGQ